MTLPPSNTDLKLTEYKNAFRRSWFTTLGELPQEMIEESITRLLEKLDAAGLDRVMSWIIKKNT